MHKPTITVSWIDDTFPTKELHDEWLRLVKAAIKEGNMYRNPTSEVNGLRVYDDGKTNPLIEISHEKLHAFLRQCADEAGYAEHSMNVCQVTVYGNTLDKEETRKIFFQIPELLIMVSHGKTVNEAKEV